MDSSTFDRLLTRASARATLGISTRWGNRLGMWQVSAYPKSGGTWLSRMIADYLGIPFPQYSRTPIAMPAVVQGHWLPSRRSNRVVYLYRDGRDVMVSSYFYRVAALRASEHQRHSSRLRKWFTNAYPGGFDPDAVRDNLAAFIQHSMEHPTGSRVNWAAHVRLWGAPDRSRPNTSYVSYEKMRSDPTATLSRLLDEGGVPEVTAAKVQQSVDRFSFERMTGRAQGQEDRSAFVRKGVVGDWKAHFTEEAAVTFNRYAARELVALGYAEDQDWWEADTGTQ